MPDIFEADSYLPETNKYTLNGQNTLNGQYARFAHVDRPDRCFTVSEINKYINGLMKSDSRLRDVLVSGEVSNFRPHYSGHLYFTLKDNSCSLRCVMFKSAASRLRFALENGQNIIASGNISVFERDGQYQLYCESIRSDGIGDLYIAFEQMKKRLSEAGLFDQARKKPLPLYPRAVCVITSPTGSVIRDIINVSIRRFPMAVIKLFPVQVQGAGAAPQIVRAIGMINANKLADVIIVARGGGSIEDLWAFNEESIAQAINDSSIPIVSAVGHETDFTICEFAADLRAPTPSAAAELVFPEAAVLSKQIDQQAAQLKHLLSTKIELAKRRLERCLSSSVFTKPTLRIEYARMRLNSAEEKLIGVMRSTNEINFSRIAVLSAKLNALSPLLTLARGYAAITDYLSGAIIKSANETAVGQCVVARLYDGALRCEVLETRADAKQ